MSVEDFKLILATTVYYSTRRVLTFCIIPVNIVATIFRSYILNVLESKSVEIIQKHEATSILTFHYEILF